MGLQHTYPSPLPERSLSGGQNNPDLCGSRSRVSRKDQKLQGQSLMPVKVSTGTLPDFCRAGISAFILFQCQDEEEG